MIERQNARPQLSKPFSSFSRRILCAGLSSLLLALAACSGNVSSERPESQLKFGVDMARQGLWSEALFRFRQADRMDPDNPRILNNLAVALEAAGRYDEALEAYRRAVALAPSNAALKRNATRFDEFYRNFQPDDGTALGSGFAPPGAEAGADDASEADDAEEGGDGDGGGGGGDGDDGEPDEIDETETTGGTP